MRQNGLLRWLAFTLALFGLAAGMLLGLAQSLDSTRASGTSTARVTTRAETSVTGAPLTAATKTESSRREPTRR